MCSGETSNMHQNKSWGRGGAHPPLGHVQRKPNFLFSNRLLLRHKREKAHWNQILRGGLNV